MDTRDVLTMVVSSVESSRLKQILDGFEGQSVSVAQGAGVVREGANLPCGQGM